MARNSNPNSQNFLDNDFYQELENQSLFDTSSNYNPILNNNNSRSISANSNQFREIGKNESNKPKTRARTGYNNRKALNLVNLNVSPKKTDQQENNVVSVIYSQSQDIYSNSSVNASNNQSSRYDIDDQIDDFDLEFDTETLQKIMETEQQYYASQAEIGKDNQQYQNKQTFNPIYKKEKNYKNNEPVSKISRSTSLNEDKSNYPTTNQYFDLSEVQTIGKSSFLGDRKTKSNNDNFPVINQTKSKQLELNGNSKPVFPVLSPNNTHKNKNRPVYTNQNILIPNETTKMLTNQKHFGNDVDTRTKPNTKKVLSPVDSTESKETSVDILTLVGSSVKEQKNQLSQELLKLKNDLKKKLQKISDLEELANLRTGEVATVRRKLQKVEKENVELQELLVVRTEKMEQEKKLIQEKLATQAEAFKTQFEFQRHESSISLRSRTVRSDQIKDFKSKSRNKSESTFDEFENEIKRSTKKRKSDLDIWDDFPKTKTKKISNKTTEPQDIIQHENENHINELEYITDTNTSTIQNNHISLPSNQNIVCTTPEIEILVQEFLKKVFYKIPIEEPQPEIIELVIHISEYIKSNHNEEKLGELHILVCSMIIESTNRIQSIPKTNDNSKNKKIGIYQTGDASFYRYTYLLLDVLLCADTNFPEFIKSWLGKNLNLNGFDSVSNMESIVSERIYFGDQLLDSLLILFQTVTGLTTCATGIEYHVARINCNLIRIFSVLLKSVNTEAYSRYCRYLNTFVLKKLCESGVFDDSWTESITELMVLLFHSKPVFSEWSESQEKIASIAGFIFNIIDKPREKYKELTLKSELNLLRLAACILVVHGEHENQAKFILSREFVKILVCILISEFELEFFENGISMMR
ncbi:hypothetical protein BB559_006878 [Furculomyces boomerangus]|uniref:Uncharacterized protein n=1 Tax=Furculomyces boomerangus TaxID=61424 RepID=A0A2T9XZ80_9FUNG|nr:hypothetical protein BB559_007046 [Furculomyces boomerangus]PVU85678.1 hypothetical protein BB559_006878 [Furculomyces boomerangus]